MRDGCLLLETIHVYPLLEAHTILMTNIDLTFNEKKRCHIGKCKFLNRYSSLVVEVLCQEMIKGSVCD